MIRTLTLRPALAVDKFKIPEVSTRAQLVHDCMAADDVTYAMPDPPLPAFLVLIQNLGAAQRLVGTRTVGAAASRDVQRDLLLTAMEMQRTYVMTLCAAAPGSAAALIQNAGMVVAAPPAHDKALLTLRSGKQTGVVTGDAHVGILVAEAGGRARESRFFEWQVSVDGGMTFVTWPTTPTGKTIIAGGFAPFVTVGVRVSITGVVAGPGPWSQIVSILIT